MGSNAVVCVLFGIFECSCISCSLSACFAYKVIGLGSPVFYLACTSVYWLTELSFAMPTGCLTEPSFAMRTLTSHRLARSFLNMRTAGTN